MNDPHSEEKRIDAIYDFFFDNIERGDFAACDAELDRLNPMEMSAAESLSVLVATMPAAGAGKLARFEAYRQRALQYLTVRYGAECVADMASGL